MFAQNFVLLARHTLFSWRILITCTDVAQVQRPIVFLFIHMNELLLVGARIYYAMLLARRDVMWFILECELLL